MPKVHNKPIKRPRKGSNKESKRQLKGTLFWRTGLSGVPPDSVRCTRALEAELFTFGKLRGRSAIIHRTVRCTPDCPVCQRSNDYFARNGRLQPHSMRYSARQSQSTRRRGTGQSTGPVGAPPDSPEAPPVRAPTVRTQRPGDVAGAPDCPVCTGLSSAPCDRQPPPNG